MNSYAISELFHPVTDVRPTYLARIERAVAG